MTIFLCGFMGCGKSTIGRLLAELLSTKFIDMDTYIQELEGMSIPEIFSSKGEPYFRTAETNAITQLADCNAVVGCGGGAMVNPKNFELATKNGSRVIFLDVPFDRCYERIKGDSNRPIVVSNSKEQLHDIFNVRHGLYLQNSSYSITIDGNAEPIENATKVFNSLK